MTGKSNVNIIAGAYATAVGHVDSTPDFRRFVDGVFALPGIDGLEIPFMHTPSHWTTLDYLRASPPASTHALTLIPAMVGGAAERPGLGLAAIDEELRAAGIAVVRRAREFIDAVNSQAGGHIVTVELHSGPRRDRGSGDAFARSLEEIVGWDWGGVSLTVEHCDALTETHEPAKGFLTIEEELDALPPGTGMVINWARSVIEKRSAGGAAEHIALSADRRALKGVVFSGCAPEQTMFGAAWEDAHLPVAGWGDNALSAASEASLLTIDELDRCVALALASPELEFLGVKVCAPPTATEAECLALLAGNLGVLESSIDRETIAGESP